MSQDPMALFPPTGAPLYLDGALSLSETYEGKITRQPLIDRADASRGAIDHGQEFRIRALLAQAPALPNLIVVAGPQRWSAVEAQLEEWRTKRVILSLARHQRPSVGDLMLESWTCDQATTDGLDLTLTLVRLRVVSTSSVQIAALPPRPAPPVAAGATGEKDAGAREVSWLKSGLNTLGTLVGR